MWRHIEQRIQAAIDDAARRIIGHIIERSQHMSASFDALKAQVTSLTSVTTSAVQLINGFAARLDRAIAAAKAGDDSAALDALSRELRDDRDALAASVAANTEADPAPPAPPAQDPPVTVPAADSGSSSTAPASDPGSTPAQ